MPEPTCITTALPVSGRVILVGAHVQRAPLAALSSHRAHGRAATHFTHATCDRSCRATRTAVQTGECVRDTATRVTQGGCPDPLQPGGLSGGASHDEVGPGTIGAWRGTLGGRWLTSARKRASKFFLPFHRLSRRSRSGETLLFFIFSLHMSSYIDRIRSTAVHTIGSARRVSLHCSRI